MGRTAPTNGDDIIDSRDVIDRIDELEDQDERDEDEEQELTALKALAEEAEGYAADWKHGETLIRDDHFEEYAQQTAEDMGLLQDATSWPLTCIDWKQAAEELQQDYTSVDFDGVTYWIR